MKKALKILAVALLLAAKVVPAQAQRRVVHYLPTYENEPYHFGFLLATGSMSYTIKTIENYQNVALSTSPNNPWPDGKFDISNTPYLYVYNVETKPAPSFTVGIIGSKRLGRYFDLRFIPSLSFGDREMNYTIYGQDNAGNISKIEKTKKVLFTTFVEFPLNIKYRSKRYNNIGAYLMAGINPKIDLVSQKKIMVPKLDDDNNPVLDENGNEVMIPNNFATKRFDCAAEIGVGYDFYNQWFKMGLEIKMSYGLVDIIKPSNLIWTAPINRISNKMFQISMLIE